MLVGWHRGWLHPQLTWPSSARWSSWGAYRASNRIDDRHSLIESNLNQLQLQTQPASPTPARLHKYIRYDLDAGDLGRNPFIYQSIHLQQLNTLSSQPDPTSTISASTDSWANVACARHSQRKSFISLASSSLAFCLSVRLYPSWADSNASKESMKAKDWLQIKNS